MPILLLIAAATGLAALLSTKGTGSGGGSGVVPLPPRPPMVTVMRHGHFYSFIFRSDRVLFDPAWLLLAAPLQPPGAAPISIPDAAHLVLLHTLQAIGFDASQIMADVMSGRGPDPTVWRGTATWTGVDGEPVDHIIPAIHQSLAAIVWIDMQDGGIPLPLPAMSVQGLMVGAPMPLHHAGHAGHPHWYPRPVRAWGPIGFEEDACGGPGFVPHDGWVRTPDGQCVYVGP